MSHDLNNLPKRADDDGPEFAPQPRGDEDELLYCEVCSLEFTLEDEWEGGGRVGGLLDGIPFCTQHLLAEADRPEVA